ncbi:beta-1,3-galactosyl-o-glycosyl-glycoprotein beta-1,6-n-acetylglucosaminyltransferase [Plakobranchus ocellatus]|uniref:Beta-1,3-galactosyl-o-glycosyl-glycoprotein beta-1,6-n-acetylglucosaminyltransferase n=1 Tax=Plakobranchus ocellatus TaxID=259542 RepID=A0AAV4CFD0_9GAST|nr:beta-1,3-galactosyl-o-glycosyl-glycoprotein beta-1,6-n-acetylglucosaminyltransferase [Plakobranchus ocellatus]
MYNLIRKFPPYVHISFVWIPAHVGIQGNENMDKLKKAALNKASYSGKLICWSDLKPKVNAYIHSVWQETWDTEGAKSSMRYSPTWARTSTKKGDGRGMIISSSCRRRFGLFQLSRRGLSQYILVCALLSTLTLSVITLRLFDHLYFTRPKPGVAKSLSFQTSIGRISNVLQLPPPNLWKPTRNFSKDLVQLRGRDFSGSDLGDLQQAVLSSALLTWDYHRNTTRPRSWFNCSKLIQADKNEQLKYQAWFAKQHRGFAILNEDIVPMMTSNCSIFKTIRRYSNTTGTAVEREYPIAYVILVHRRFEHLERLVRALYRPQHSFCIHIDSKASCE